MSTELVVSTLNVTFGTETSSNNVGITLEIDDRKDGYNAGETSFKPGDSVYYWLFKGSSITNILEHFTTAGSTTFVANDSKEVIEDLTFSNSNEATLQYPPSNTVTLEYLGRSYKVEKGAATPSAPTLVLDGQYITTNETVNGVTASPKIVALVRAKYETTGEIHLLSVEKQAAIDFKQVMVVVIGEYEVEE